MLWVFFIMIGISIFVSLLQARIYIKELKLSNLNSNQLEFSYLIYLGLYLGGKIKIIEVTLDKTKIKNSKLFCKMKNQNMIKEMSKMDIFENLKVLKLNVESFKLDLQLGTENVIFTTYAVAIISTVISILIGIKIKNYNKEQHYFKVSPIFNKNTIDLRFESIIYLKKAHIIRIIYKELKRRSDKKNERTSNRKSYGYGYE